MCFFLSLFHTSLFYVIRITLLSSIMYFVFSCPMIKFFKVLVLPRHSTLQIVNLLKTFHSCFFFPLFLVSCNFYKKVLCPLFRVVHTSCFLFSLGMLPCSNTLKSSHVYSFRIFEGLHFLFLFWQCILL